VAGVSEQRLSRRRPSLLGRLFFRAPIMLYRIGLGGLMPMQLLLTTVGRKSGRPRHAVVDVLRHDAATDTYYVVSAYGAHSDWYRNLQANPTLRVQVRWRKFPARAAILPEEEAADMLLDFWRHRRLYARAMMRLVGLKAASEEEARALAGKLRVVAIEPEAGR
jgi:deazaflavin-dependent oxidoreductase (nitroreductase family)